MAVSGGDAAFTKLGQHRRVVDIKMRPNTSEGPAEVVEADGVVDLLGGESAAAHRHVVSFEDVADRPPLDAEPGTQLVHRRSGLIVGDEFLDLIGVELACPSGFGAFGGRWSRAGAVG
jgi:hypothetical protein